MIFNELIIFQHNLHNLVVFCLAIRFNTLYFDCFYAQITNPMLRILILFGLSIFLLGGCVNNDYTKISDSILFKPNYSLPIGAQNSVVPTPLSNNDLGTVALSDTIEYSLTDIADKREYIEWLMFRVSSSNSYPAEVQVSVDYYDEGWNFLGSFTSSNPFIIAKPTVDASKGTTGTNSNQVDYFISDSDIDQVIKMNYILITTTITNVTLSDELRANWNDFTIYTTVGIQAQLRKQN